MKTLILTALAGVLAAQAAADAPPPPPESPVMTAYDTVCMPLNVTLYFGGNSTELSPQSLAALGSTLSGAEGCAVTAIRATTVSSDAAADGALLEVSEARTDSVLEAIAASGVWAESVQTDIVLARSINRSDTAIEPLSRRVEVQLQTARSVSS